MRAPRDCGSLPVGAAPIGVPGSQGRHTGPLGLGQPAVRGQTLDSIRIGADAITLFGLSALPYVGYSLVSNFFAHNGALIVDLIEVPGRSVGAAVVFVPWTARITGLARARYSVTVRDLPIGAFAAIQGCVVHVDLRRMVSGSVRCLGSDPLLSNPQLEQTRPQ